MDVDIVMRWPLDKIHEYIAYYMTQNPEVYKQITEEMKTPEDKHEALARLLGATKV